MRRSVAVALFCVLVSGGSAFAQAIEDQIYMPLIRAQIDPGDTTTPAESLEGGFREATYQFDAGLAWDDTDLRVSVTVQHSIDGGVTWKTIKASTFVGGSRTRSGELPVFSLPSHVEREDGTLFGQVRFILTVNRRISLGLIGTKLVNP